MTYLSITLLVILISCKNYHSIPTIAYGESFFSKNCSACHGLFHAVDSSPSLLTLNNYDSLTFFKKLNKIREDSLHGPYLQSIKFSEKEIRDQVKFLGD